MHCHIQLKKKASLCVFSWFWMLHLELCSRAHCSLISRAHEGLWEQGRCDPSWQMVHTLLCRESLKEEGSQSHSAHQSQPQASHLWLRGFPQGVPGKVWGWWLQGHILDHSPSSKAWWFHHLSYGGCAGSILGFPAATSSAPPDLGRSSDCGMQPGLPVENV